MNKLSMLFSSTLLLLCTSTGALAVDPITIELEFAPNLDQGKQSFRICARCHLPEAWGNEDGTYPQLAGQHVNVLMKQLMDIRTGKRQSPLMYPFVQQRTLGGYQDMSNVVAYISTLPMNKRHTRGPWSPGSDRYEAGKKLYRQFCISCHGERAQGDNVKGYPRLQGQHFPYMSRQLIAVKQGLRQVNDSMRAIVDQLSEEQLENVIDYISYIDPDPDKLAPGQSTAAVE